MKIRKNQKPVIGIGWYKKEQWSLLRENSVDVDDLDNTYYEWMANANETIRKFSDSGCRVEKIDIDVEELIEWCKNENSVLNGESRASFISLKTKEKYH